MTKGVGQRWLSVVPSLATRALRAGFLRRELTGQPVEDVAQALELVCGEAEQASHRAADVLGAATPTLCDPSAFPLIAQLRQVAASSGHLALARLLRSPPTEPGDASSDDDPTLAKASDGRTLTLGERKAHARGRDRFLLDRLLRDPHPLVIRNVLTNPRITEDDVVRLAARRPNHAPVFYEILRHPEWSGRRRVRLALIQNPYAPPYVAVLLVRLLTRPELRQVLDATDISPVVRAGAMELLDRRPPVPSTEVTSTQ